MLLSSMPVNIAALAIQIYTKERMGIKFGEQTDRRMMHLDVVNLAASDVL